MGVFNSVYEKDIRNSTTKVIQYTLQFEEKHSVDWAMHLTTTTIYGLSVFG